mgnify:CR=1 FL=1
MNLRDPAANDSLPFTVVIPEDHYDWIEIYDQHAALKMAVVERNGAILTNEEWDAPGVYILLDRPDADGRWGVYAGKAPAGIRARLRDHLRNKDHWYRALLIRRDTTLGFNSAQIGWLEGRLYDLFTVATDAVLHNGNRPRDETLPPYDRQMLEMVILPVRRVLRLLGHDPATADDDPELSPTPRSKRYHGITVAQLIETGVLYPGTTLTSTNGAWPASAAVTMTGEIVYAGEVYLSPSGAAEAAKDGPANGWEFWAVETDTGKVPLSVLRERCRARLEANGET